MKENRLKILVVCQYYHPEPFRIADICEALAARGHSVTVLTGLPNYPEGVVPEEYRRGKRRDETIGGVRVVRVFQAARGQGNVRRLLNYFTFAVSGWMKAWRLENDFDIVFVNQLSPVMMAVPGIRYARKHRKPLLLYCLDLWPASLCAGGVREWSVIYRVFHWISRKIYRRADRILVSSGMFAEYFRDELGVRDVPIDHLPQYAEDIFGEDVHPIPGNYASDYASNFVFAGNIGDVQGVDIIVRAAAVLRDRGCADIGFHILGEGSALQKCRDLAEDLGLENVVFYGRKPAAEMPSYYAMADALLVTLRPEGELSRTLPGKVQSYMAAGKPIIGAITGEGARVIGEAGCGLVVAPDDAEALADAVLRMADGGENGMGARGRAYYDAHFAKERFLEKLEEEFQCTMHSSQCTMSEDLHGKS